MQTLQIGDEWHTERAGGLNSYYFELLRHLGPTGTVAHGLVVGSDNVRVASEGQVVAFARPEAALPTRMLSLRRLALQQMTGNRIDLIASHFALYAMPILDRLKKIPTVVHFHGPWAAESNAERSEQLPVTGEGQPGTKRVCTGKAPDRSFGRVQRCADRQLRNRCRSGSGCAWGH